MFDPALKKGHHKLYRYVGPHFRLAVCSRRASLSAPPPPPPPPPRAVPKRLGAEWSERPGDPPFLTTRPTVSQVPSPGV